LDVAALQAPEPSPAIVGTELDSAAEAVPASPDDFYISDEPLPLDWLDSFDANIDWRTDVLVTQFFTFHEVELDVNLVDARLAIGPLRGNGDNGGSIFGSIVLEPYEDAYRATVTLTAEQLPLTLSESGEEGQQRSPHDARVKLQGQGRSLHEMAATAEGNLVVIQGAGAFNAGTLLPLTRDALSQLASSIGITSQQESTGLECGVHVYTFLDGRVRLDPFALVTDEAQIVGRGTLDLKTEKLDVAWAAKPRKGIGLSASAITNPYVKLGGTLSKPSISVQPLRAAAATAAAWTTGGLSFLAKGFWDRATSGKKICRKARKEAEFEFAP
jgi:hypothetical protein